MVDPVLLDILMCPDSRQVVEEASSDLVERVNGAIAAGRLRNRAGETIHMSIQGGLVRQDGRWLYPVREGIPIMLVDEAIPLEGLTVP